MPKVMVAHGRQSGQCQTAFEAAGHVEAGQRAAYFIGEH